MPTFNANVLPSSTGFDLGSAAQRWDLFAQDIDARRINNIVNVKGYGATGDGSTDDATAIQAAIDDAKTLGVTDLGTSVFFPPGNYIIGTPLVLPRTGLTPTNVVHLSGANIRTAMVRGSSSFPANRALVEWEVSATRAWHQSIKDMRFILPDVTGVMAINYVPTLKSTAAEILAETLQIDLKNILLEGSNEFHSVFIKLEGNLKLCSIKNIYGDPILGTWAQDTLCLQTDTTDYSSEGSDSSGFISSVIENVQGGVRRGGFGLVFSGRLTRSSFNTALNGVGGRNGIGYNFVNSTSSTITNIGNEGTGEKPQIKVDGGRHLTFINFGLGTPADAGSGVGNGMELVDTDDSVFISRWARAGLPSFTSLSVKAITLDASSSRNRFFRLGLNDTLTNEITDSGSDNYFESFNYATPAWQYSGTLLRGELDADNYLTPATFDNNADAASIIILDAGVSAAQVREIRFLERGVQEWTIRADSTGPFSVNETSPNIDRIRFGNGADNVYAPGAVGQDHRFVDGDGTTRRVTLHGDADKISLGSALDTNLYRSAANTLKTDDAFVHKNVVTLDDTGTPSVAGANVFTTGGTTAITAFDDGVNGQIITVISAHSVTITDGASLHLNGGNYAMTDNDTLTLVFDGSEWYETGRAVD